MPPSHYLKSSHSAFLICCRLVTQDPYVCLINRNRFRYKQICTMHQPGTHFFSFVRTKFYCILSVLFILKNSYAYCFMHHYFIFASPRSHTGERPFKCVQCSRGFASSGVLKAHIRTHSGLKAYKCLVCDTTFTTSGSLRRHMTTHSDLRPYMCPYCQKTFKSSPNCRKHMKTHRFVLCEGMGCTDLPLSFRELPLQE